MRILLRTTKGPESTGELGSDSVTDQWAKLRSREQTAANSTPHPNPLPPLLYPQPLSLSHLMGEGHRGGEGRDCEHKATRDLPHPRHEVSPRRPHPDCSRASSVRAQARNRDPLVSALPSKPAVRPGRNNRQAGK